MRQLCEKIGMPVNKEEEDEEGGAAEKEWLFKSIISLSYWDEQFKLDI